MSVPPEAIQFAEEQIRESEKAEVLRRYLATGDKRTNQKRNLRNIAITMPNELVALGQVLQTPADQTTQNHRAVLRKLREMRSEIERAYVALWIVDEEEEIAEFWTEFWS